MQSLKIQIKGLRILCDIACDEIRKLSPQHELLVYQNKDLPYAEKQLLQRRFFSNYGPKSMDRTKPTEEDWFKSFEAYRFTLLAALAIEKAKQWGNLPKA